LVVGTINSAAEEVARQDRGAKVVKAFNTIGAANFAKPRFGTQTARMFITGDDTAAKGVAARPRLRKARRSATSGIDA
jgi:8-hydroxy-5-deazaflavin:NADPH oxidoreductase